MNWVAFLILAMIFILTPYQRGLFFDSDMYLIEGIMGILFIVYAVWHMIKKRDDEQSFYLFVFLLPLMYLISLFVAETPKGAWDNLLRWFTYVSMFMMLIWLRSEEKIKKLFPYVFHLTGIFIVIYALFGFWGWVEFKDIVLVTRLTGFFQYANTFATVLGAFWLFSLVALTRKNVRVFDTVYLTLPLVGYGVSFLLSESRGALLVFPAAWFAGLILLSAKRQILYLFYTLISLLASFLVYQDVAAQRAVEGAKNPGLTAVVVGTLVVIAVITGIQLLVNTKLSGRSHRWENKRCLQWILPGASVLLCLLLFLDLTNKGLVYQQLPGQLQQRISDINLETSSVVGRSVFFEDAWKMSKDAPLLGYGGEGWRVLFTQYQHQPYWSNETHNGYLEVLLNTGWLGLTVFVLLFGFLFVQVLRRSRDEKEDLNRTMALAAWPSLVMIFLHAAIDFDFSYGTVWLIVFWLFAMGVSDKPLFKREESVPWIGKAAVSLMVVFVFIFTIYSLRFYKAELQVAKAQGSLPLDQAQKIYESATSSNPYHVDYWFGLSRVYIQAYGASPKDVYKAKAVEILNKAEELEPRNPQVLFKIGSSYASLGEPFKAVEYMDRAKELDRFNVDFYDNSIYVKSTLASLLMADQNKDVAKAKQLAQASLEDLVKYHSLFAPYKQKPIPDMRKIELGKGGYFYAGQSHLILGQYEQALEVMQPISNDDAPELVKKANAARVVAFEQLGNRQEADHLMNMMKEKSPDFEQFVKEYRKSLGL